MRSLLTLAGRHNQRLMVALVLSLLCLLLVSPQVGFAQADPPPPDNANPRTATTTEDTAVTIDTGIPSDPRYRVAIVLPGPSHGTIATDGSGSNFTITYTPGSNQTSPVSFLYQICTRGDTPLCGQSALVMVTITPVNDGPQAGQDFATVKYGQSVLINILANDNGGINEFDSITLVPGSVSAPNQGGTATIEGNQVRYTAPTAPSPCLVNQPPASFTYLIQDSSGLQGSGLVTVTRTCPGTPTLKLTDAYAFSNHTFKVDVILESTDVNVAAVDFFLGYDLCVADVDVPSNGLADDVTNMPAAPNFVSQVQDGPLPNILHFISAGVLPNAVLAGPTNTQRTIATLHLKAQPNCSQTTLTFSAAGFTGTGGTPITGQTATEPRQIPLDGRANNKPTNITLTNNKVAENAPLNTFIGKFSTTDADPGDTFIYTCELLLGNKCPSPFNPRAAAFNNDELDVTGALTPGNHNITIRSTDSYGGFITKTFTIEVLDVNRFAPIGTTDTGTTVNGRYEIASASLIANDIDIDDGDTDCDTCSIQSVTNGLKGLVTNLGSKVVYIPTDPKFYFGSPSYPLNPTASDTFTYILTDNDPAGALTGSATVTVNVYRDNEPGNCNGSLPTIMNPVGIEAGDLTATGLEIFDGDGNLWYDIYKGSYTNFSPYGCNSNQDNVVDAGDIACTAAKIFNPALTCAPVTSASSSVASLTVSRNLNATRGATVNVPIALTAAGNSVAAAAFSVDFDNTVLSFDATDANADGLPDAVAFNVPGGLMTSATYNAAESRVEIVITGLVPPFPLLSDGTIATVSLTVNDDAAAGTATVTLSNGSLGSDEGASVPVEIVDGSVDISGQAAARTFYLPMISAE